MVEKKEGSTMTCKNCSTVLTCRWTKATGNFAAKLQWQNPDGQAHYHTSDGVNFTCNTPEGIQKKTQDNRVSETKTQTENLTISEEQKITNGQNMVESLWPIALEKAKEVYKIPNTVTEPQTNKDVMILAQVFFKSMMESYNK